jgi:hypothetical protein
MVALSIVLPGGWIEDNTMIRFDHIDNHANDGWWREVLAAFLCAGHGKFVQEIFVDTPENITGSTTEGVTVEYAHQIPQQVRIKLSVFLGQSSFKHIDLVFNQLHGIYDSLADILIFGQIHKVIVLSFFGKIDRGFAFEIIWCKGSANSITGWLCGFNLFLHLQEAVVGMAQKDQTKHRHGVFGCC